MENSQFVLRQVKHTGFESKGMTRKPDESKGPSSGNISSIGAKTSSEQAPTAFSSIPLHICQHSKQLDSWHEQTLEESIIIKPSNQ